MEQYVDSPTLPTQEGIVKTEKEFSDALTLDLTDHEIGLAGQIIQSVRGRYYGRGFSTIEQGISIIEDMEREMQHEFATQLGVLVRIDSVPMLSGEPPILEIMGKLPGTTMAKYGMDHEKKEWEVKKANDRGEAFLGQKSNPDTAKARRKAKREQERQARKKNQ